MDFSLENFLKSGKHIDYKKNAHILKQGKISRRVFFVIDGVVRHYMLDYSGNIKNIGSGKVESYL